MDHCYFLPQWIFFFCFQNPHLQTKDRGMHWTDAEDDLNRCPSLFSFLSLSPSLSSKIQTKVSVLVNNHNTLQLGFRATSFNTRNVLESINLPSAFESVAYKAEKQWGSRKPLLTGSDIQRQRNTGPRPSLHPLLKVLTFLLLIKMTSL